MTLPFPPEQYYTRLPPVPAPVQPQAGQFFEVGTLSNLVRRRVLSVSKRGFTVTCNSLRHAHPLADWHPWLVARCQEGPVHLAGYPMLPPQPAGLSGNSPPPKVRTTYAGPRRNLARRDNKLLRAVRDVLKTYEITRHVTGDGALRFAIKGGKQPYNVTVTGGALQQVACTCPDGEWQSSQGSCKHALAVMLGQPDLQYLALDFFL